MKSRWMKDPNNPRRIVSKLYPEQKVATCSTKGTAALILHRMEHYYPMLEAAKDLLRGATFEDGLGVILTQDAEALEAAITAAEEG